MGFRLFDATVLAAVLSFNFVVFPAEAQRIPADEYIHFVPLEMPRAIRETEASRRLPLFGDREAPGYRDISPRDGIDDQRHDRLMALAVRFAPLMVQNTPQSAPLDASGLTDAQGRRSLFRDTWNMKSVDRQLVSSVRIDLDSADRSSLKDLLADYHPYSPLAAVMRARSVRPDTSLVDIVYLDLPGASPSEWDSIYVDPKTHALRDKFRPLIRSFVHPFVSGDADSGYELVLQYWFFYPFNDGGNNHTGDWEHINVVVAPLDRVTSRLGSTEIERMLETPDEALSDLAIRRLEFYPHNKFIALDMSRPNVYAPKEEWRKEVLSMFGGNSSRQWVAEQIRYRAYLDDKEQVINTHPVVYIGADNKGTDQILSPPGGSNRDSHASYPFAGVYKGIGPAGAAEEIDHQFSHRKFFRVPPEKQLHAETYKKGGPLLMAREDRLVIVPDVDRLANDILVDEELLASWYWVITPMRWGYPAIKSPFAGIVANAETGNLGAVGPSFNDAWNRSGETPVYQTFDAQAVPSFFPAAWQDEFKNSFGYFNLGWPTVSFLPPFDLLYRGVAAPARFVIEKHKPTFYSVDKLPIRFIGVSSGVAVHAISEEFTRLLFNNQQVYPLLTGVLEAVIAAAGDTTGEFIDEKTKLDPAVSAFGQVNFFLGRKFVSENNLRHSRSGFRQTAVNEKPEQSLDLTATLNMWEYYGSLRYNILSNNLQPFVKAGYGLSWYRFEGVAVAGKEISVPDSPWTRKPNLLKFKNIWPNTVHVGAGVEMLLRKGYQPRLFHGTDVSLKIEWMAFRHAVGIAFEDVPIDVLVALRTPIDSYPIDTGVWRNALQIGLTLSL